MTTDTSAAARAANEKLLTVLALTLIVSAMSATMFNIVLPEMSRQFNLSYASVSWISTAYLLVYAVGSAIYGKLADMFRLKRLLAFGLILFAAGSLLGLAAVAAGSFPAALAGRIVQAAGAAVIPAAAMIIPVRYFPPERRGRALGMTATGIALGNAVGPVVTALLVSFVHWQWLFTVPLILLGTLPFYSRYLGDERGQGGRIDWIGGGLLAATAALFLLAITEGSLIAAAGGLLALGLFVIRIRRAEAPFVQPRLFRSGRYSLGLALAMLIMGIGYAFIFLTPQMLAEVNRLDTGAIGFVMVPAAAVSALLGRKAGKFADTHGNPVLFGAASALLMTAFVLLSFAAGADPLWIVALLVVGQSGQMFMQIALNNTISRTLPREQAGTGMGLLTMLNFLSGASAAALYSRIVDQGAGGWRFNPLSLHAEAAVFSNIYAVLALLHVLILVLYMARYGRVSQPQPPAAKAKPAE